MSVKVSVIIPVYNVESYLQDCIESVIQQTLNEIEIILLDDGSTDNSKNICAEYVAKDCRVRVYSHKNIGLGCTRNRGIALAQGEYLAFVDSDDTIEPRMFQRLYETARSENADVVCGETMFWYPEKGLRRLRHSFVGVPSVSLKQMPKEKFLKKYYLSRIYTPNAWDKLYKKDLIVNNHILFGDRKRVYGEDNWFQLQIFEYVDKICFVCDPCYNYRLRSDSLCASYTPHMCEMHLTMMQKYYNMFCAQSLVNKQLCSHLTFELFSMQAMNTINAGKKMGSFMEEMAPLKQSLFFREQLLYFVSSNTYLWELSFKRQLFARITAMLWNHRRIKFALAEVYSTYLCFHKKSVL